MAHPVVAEHWHLVSSDGRDAKPCPAGRPHTHHSATAAPCVPRIQLRVMCPAARQPMRPGAGKGGGHCRAPPDESPTASHQACTPAGPSPVPQDPPPCSRHELCERPLHLFQAGLPQRSAPGDRVVPGTARFVAVGRQCRVSTPTEVTNNCLSRESVQVMDKGLISNSNTLTPQHLPPSPEAGCGAPTHCRHPGACVRRHSSTHCARNTWWWW